MAPCNLLFDVQHNGKKFNLEGCAPIRSNSRLKPTENSNKDEHQTHEAANAKKAAAESSIGKMFGHASDIASILRP